MTSDEPSEGNAPESPTTEPSADDWTPPADWPDDEEVVRAAAEAAEEVVFSRIGRSDVADLDVTVSFEAGILEVDVYLDAPDADDAERVADDAALAARAAADDLLES